MSNSLMPIVLLAGIGIVAYYLLKDHPFLTQVGKGVDAIGKGGSDVGEFLGQTAHRASEFDIKSRKKEAEVGGAIMGGPKYIYDSLNEFVDRDIAAKKARAQTTIGKIQDSIGGTANAIQQFFGGGTRDSTLEEILDERASVLHDIQEQYDLPDGKKKLNPPSPPKITNNMLDDLISGALKGNPFRPYSGTVYRPYD